jgi:putative SOS response-associated peptidase YedK
VCGRFTSSQRREAIGERFEVSVPEGYVERYNLAPAQRALIVRPRETGREAVLAKWGLLPHWAKDAKVAFKMINARAETLTAKPAYRGLLTTRRCLVVADGFYEWTCDERGRKVPVRFSLADGELFAFAGLWTSRKDDTTGDPLDTFTIVTTTPNPLVAPVHDRMPVILQPEHERSWLDGTISKEHALSLLQPYPAELMTASAASARVNSIRNDDPAVLIADDALAA